MDSPSQEPGVAFGRYRLIRRIATGGMGELYLAEMPGAAGIRKRVVIKRILPHLARDDRFVGRFLDEGRLMAQLSHGNLVPVFEVGLNQGRYYLAMEYVEGLDLDALIRALRAAGEAFDPAVVAVVVDEIARGLEYVHGVRDASGASLGIVHRDINPQNIMVTPAGEVKILDFGIARATVRLLQSLPGTLAGKIGYMAPEQVRGDPATEQSDLYALGVVAWEMLGGEPLHTGASEQEVLARVREGAARPLRSVRPETPEILANLVDACCAPDPALRPRSASALRSGIADATRAHDLSGGEVALRDLVQRFHDRAPPPTDSFEELLLQQMDASDPKGAGRQGAPGRGRTRAISREPPGSDAAPGSPNSLAAAGGLAAPGPGPSPTFGTGVEGPRRGFKRWMMLAAAIGILLGLGLMLLFERMGPPSGAGIPAGTRAGGADGGAADVLSGALSDASATTASDPGLGRAGPEPAGPADLGRTRSEDTGSRDASPGARTVGPQDVTGPSVATVRVVVSPSTAILRVRGRQVGVGRASIRGAAGHPITVEITATGRVSRTLTVVPGRDRIRTLTLAERVTGRLIFRYFPARAEIRLDGKPLDTGGSNRVEVALPVGRHEVYIRDPVSKRSRTVVVTIAQDRTRNLGTLEVGRTPTPADTSP